jgi:hypothetical protein
MGRQTRMYVWADRHKDRRTDEAVGQKDGLSDRTNRQIRLVIYNINYSIFEVQKRGRMEEKEM